ncbi:MAG TPA: ABC transporter permease subunit [bacterium]|nr:ABC transporter permease subunit [bacterium]
MRLNKAVFLHALRSQADARVRLILAGLLGLILYVSLSGGVTLNGMGLAGIGALLKACNSLLLLMVWLLGLGLISREASSGSLQLVLLRPVSRPSYLLSKWAALSALGWALLLLAHASFLAHQGLGGVDAGTYGAIFGAQCLQVAAVAAMVAFFSCVPIAFGELGLLALFVAVFLVLKVLNFKLASELLGQTLDLAWRALLPGVDYDGGLGSLAAGAAFNAGVLLAALAGAVAVLRRREFTYADHG